MRNTSSAYKKAVIGPELHTSISGTIKTAAQTYAITDKLVIPGSVTISRKAINQSSFEYGAAVASEATISLLLPADRYAMYDAELCLNLHTQLPDGTEEVLKLGTWNVSECTRSTKVLQYKAYDNMLRFDADIMDDTTGYAYDLLKYACDKCGVAIGQTQSEIATFVNADVMLKVAADEVETYRDMICYVAKLTCSYAMIDVDGRLVLRTFQKEPCMSLIKRQVLTSAISDYKSQYRGVKARFIADQNYAPYEVIEEGVGLVLDMGDIPILKGGVPEVKTAVLTKILNELKQMVYTPANITMLQDAAIEPGDMLLVKNANLTEEDVTILVTSVTWNYHSSMSLVSAGSNPRLASVKDKSSKQLSQMETTILNRELTVLTYENAEIYAVKQEYVEVASISYTTSASCRPIFMMTVSFTLDYDGVVEFALYNGLVAIPHTSYKQLYSSGVHFASIFYVDTADENERKNLRILAKVKADESSVYRKQAADIETLKNAISAIQAASDVNAPYTTKSVDVTEPTLTVDIQSLRAVLWSQGIGSKAEWDGDLEFTDTIDEVVEISGIISEFNDVISTWLDVPKTSVITEEMPSIGMEGMTVLSYNSNIGFNEVIEQYIVDTSRAGQYIYESKYVNISDGFRLQSNYYMQGEYDESGIATIELDTTIYQTVSGIEIDTDTGAKYLLYAGGVYYDTDLNVINIDAVTPDAMMEYGSDAWTVDLTAYSSCKLFKYNTSEARIPLSATIDAEPYAQTIQTDAIDLSNPTITGIEYVTVDAGGAPTFAVSFDAGTTWMMHTGTAWVELSAEESGMQVSTFIAITTEQWAEQTVGIDDVRLKISLTGMNDVVRSIVIDYTN